MPAMRERFRALRTLCVCDLPVESLETEFPCFDMVLRAMEKWIALSRLEIEEGLSLAVMLSAMLSPLRMLNRPLLLFFSLLWMPSKSARSSQREEEDQARATAKCTTGS